jgi:hypothetical protein
MSVFKTYDALARAYGPSWLCNDVTRPFWQNRSLWTGPEREDDMVAIQRGAAALHPETLYGLTGATCGTTDRVNAPQSVLN